MNQASQVNVPGASFIALEGNFKSSRIISFPGENLTVMSEAGPVQLNVHQLPLCWISSSERQALIIQTNGPARLHSLQLGRLRAQLRIYDPHLAELRLLSEDLFIADVQGQAAVISNGEEQAALDLSDYGLEPMQLLLPVNESGNVIAELRPTKALIGAWPAMNSEPLICSALALPRVDIDEWELST